MIVNTNGHRYINYGLYESQLHRPYDYALEGLLKHIISRRIMRTKNPILQYMLQVMEQALIFMSKSTDMVQNVFNYNWKNR
jgi:hypothetical protein